jgi:SAM-dependent methyltransferase
MKRASQSMATAKIFFDPAARMIGGFSPLDGTIEFFTRISALLEPHFKVLDLGAGRGGWNTEDHCSYRRGLRDIRGKVAEYIGADVDKAVLTNPTTSRNLVIGADGHIPLEDEEIDLIICDYVLEHILDVDRFRDEVDRVLTPGGMFCGRTPHSANYVSLAARLIKSVYHVKWLKTAQPARKAADVFPTVYRCNTLRELERLFPDWGHFSYLYTAEPSYYFGARWAYSAFSALHRFGPAAFTGNIFIFIRKPSHVISP